MSEEKQNTIPQVGEVDPNKKTSPILDGSAPQGSGTERALCCSMAHNLGIPPIFNIHRFMDPQISQDALLIPAAHQVLLDQ